MALGIAFSPSGKMDEEVQYLRKRTTKWAKAILKANLTHYEAWMAIKTTIFKTVEYALAATTMSKKKSNKLLHLHYRLVYPNQVYAGKFRGKWSSHHISSKDSV
jgi:hypothetical protein